MNERKKREFDEVTEEREKSENEQDVEVDVSDGSGDGNYMFSFFQLFDMKMYIKYPLNVVIYNFRRRGRC